MQEVRDLRKDMKNTDRENSTLLAMKARLIAIEKHAKFLELENEVLHQRAATVSGSCVSFSL